MKNLYLLPTDKPSKYVTNYMEQTMQFHNIYITSEEEIKEGDWCILLENHYVNGGIGKYNTERAIGYGLHNTKFFQKIILTTDQDLIKNGVQAIDDEFLQWFVNNPSCEMVEVYEVGGKLFAEPIIPKEESRQETLEEAAKIIIPELKHIINDVSTARELWIKGAKWQAERMYSEEDMKSFGKFCSEYDYRCFGSKTQEEMLSIWFEQFKKK